MPKPLERPEEASNSNTHDSLGAGAGVSPASMLLVRERQMPDLDHIGKYEIRREIGRGAMGVVYEAYDPMIKRVVALKTIRQDQLSGEDSVQMINRFRREAQAAGRLNHPNIVSIYDFGEESGIWYIAMEFVTGRELKTCFEANERFRIPDVVKIMTQILGALDYSHRQGVIHRDIKPANIFLLTDGSVKVGDFGIAHIEASNLTQVGTVLGTPSYMSPEQIMGLPVDGRSDLFSAGVILYQFLTGERPFSGSATTTMQKVLKEDPLPPSSINIQVLPVMDAVVRKALAKHTDERYQTAQEFADAVGAAASTTSSLAAAARATNTDATIIVPLDAGTSRTAAPTAAAASPSVTRPAAALPPAASAASAPSRIPATAVIVVAVIAVGAGAWFAYQRFTSDAARSAESPVKGVAVVAQMPSPAPPGPATATPATDPGALRIAAVGLIDPTDPRYKGDKTLQQEDARADAKSQVVAKALGLLLDTKSLDRNYDLLKERLLSNSGNYIKAVVRESEPRVGKDGLMSVTTEAIVNVKALQKSLNQMTRDERVEMIRANGDPKVSVQVTVRDSDQPDAPPQVSPVAENILKERIKTFGFRTWAEGGAEGRERADFAVRGEAKIKKMSIRLEASGLPVTRYTLTSWTVKCVDLATGEEVYFNTTLPKGVGSWPSEEEALKAIGARIADEFSRDFFLQHGNIASKKVVLSVDGMPDAAAEDTLARELIGLPSVIAVTTGPPAKPRIYALQLSGDGTASDLVAVGVLKPLNAMLGQACFSLGASTGDTVAIAFDKACTDAAILSRFESNPPAGLYGAPLSRQKSVIRDPTTLRKLTT
jgi:eukaryotic-like serine/threonine-protein kinase